MFVQITPRTLTKEMNEIIIPKLQIEKKHISESTAKCWMIRMGYEHKTYQKGVYMDGHERTDVVQYRTQFLDKLKAIDQ